MSTVVSYTTVSLMQMTLAEVGSISTMTDSVLLLHAGAAEARINAKISKRYALPFTQEIPLLETLSTDMAIYRVLTGRIIINHEHPWFARYRDAVKVLNEIADGSLPLLDSTGSVLEGRSDNSMEVWSNTKGYQPTHWEGDWSHHNTDQDKLDAEANKRNINLIRGRLK